MIGLQILAVFVLWIVFTPVVLFLVVGAEQKLMKMSLMRFVKRHGNMDEEEKMFTQKEIRVKKEDVLLYENEMFGTYEMEYKRKNEEGLMVQSEKVTIDKEDVYMTDGEEYVLVFKDIEDSLKKQLIKSHWDKNFRGEYKEKLRHQLHVV